MTVICLLHQHHRLAKPLSRLSDIDQPNITRDTYTLRSLHITTIHPENFERHFFPLVFTLPNFGDMGDVLCAVSLLHDALKFIY